MPFENSDAKIIDEIETHYKESDSPYDLARFGKFIRDNNIEVPEGVKLKDYLKSRFHGRFVVVQDPDVKARIAVATLENQKAVRQRLLGQDPGLSDVDEVDTKRLPFALVAAFCKVPEEGKRLFFRMSPPFRYETHAEAPDDTYVEIEAQRQPPSLRGVPVHTLSEREKQTVYNHVIDWAKAKSIDLRTVYYERHFNQDIEGQSVGRPTSNALQRLLDAQSPAIRDKMKIPVDIMNILLRHR